jgi:hypothetical protein
MYGRVKQRPLVSGLGEETDGSQLNNKRVQIEGATMKNNSNFPELNGGNSVMLSPVCLGNARENTFNPLNIEHRSDDQSLNRSRFVL